MAMRSDAIQIIDGKLPCTGCKQWLPVDCFNINCARPCGRVTYCRPCQVVEKDTWRKANLARIAEYQAAWREENAEHLVEHERQRYQSDPEFHRQRVVAYRRGETGRRMRALWQQNRMARANGVVNTLTDDEWLQLVAKYDGRCLACGRADRPVTRDHVIPLSLGGALTLENTQPLCRPCNSRKHARIIDYRPTEDCPDEAAS
jgi:5-methylcytosine-specific restriction endonuclease McrA